MMKGNSSNPPAANGAGQSVQSLPERISKAMREIELDIDRNNGVYPYNKGRVTQAEVCRRASVHKVTLQKPMHRDTTRKSVTDWLAGLFSNLVKGRRSIRRSVTERANTAEERATEMATHYHIARIELQDARRTIRELQQKLLEAKDMNEALRALLPVSQQDKVIALKSRGESQRNPA